MSELVDAVKKLIKLSEENIENIRVLTAENAELKEEVHRLGYRLAATQLNKKPGGPQSSSADLCTYVVRNRGGSLPNEIYCETHGWGCPKLNDPDSWKRIDAPETP